MLSKQEHAVMARTEHLEAYGLFMNGWKTKEIAVELGKSVATIRSWRSKFSWDWKLAKDLRDIELEMKEKVQLAREKIIDIGTQTLEDIFIRDTDGKVIGVAIAVEDVKDLKIITETLLKTAGIADKIETKSETKISGDISVKTEQISPEMAAEIGRVLALKNSVQNDE